MDTNLNDFVEEQWEKEEREKFSFYSCPACETEFFARKELKRCIYCGRDMLSGCDSQSVKPDGIIPFSVDKEKAVRAFKDFCKGKKLLPKSLKEADFERGTQKVYIPVWVLNGKGKSTAVFDAAKGESFKEGKTECIRKDFYSLKREGEVSFEDFIVKNEKLFGFLDNIKPYYFAEAKDFDTRYIEDAYVYKFDRDIDEAAQKVRSAVEKILADEYKKDISDFSHAELDKISVSFDSQYLEYILVSVWLMNFKYDGAVHSFAVNGQTGSFAGKAPVGKSEFLKYFLLVFVIIAVIGIIIAMIS